MTVERARELLELKNATDEEVVRMITRDKKAMSALLKNFIHESLDTERKN